MANNGAIVVTDPSRPISVVSSGAKVSRVVTAGTRGPRGPEGPAGESAYELWISEGNTGTVADFLASLGAGSYTHSQLDSQLEWAIQHNLGYFPNVMSFDSAGSQIIGDVTHIDSNRMIITFSHPSGGKAYLS